MESTVEALETGRNSYFSTIEDKRKRGSQVNSLRYIKDLASMTRTDISDWNILDIFSTEDGALVTDRKQINKRFFRFMESAPSRASGLTDSQIADLNAVQKSVRQGSVEDIISRRDSYIREAHGNYEVYLNYLKKAAGFEAQARAIQGYSTNLARDVALVEQAGFFKYIGVIPNSDTLHFETINDVALTHVDEKYGIFRKVNLERFDIYLDTTRSKVRVVPKPSSVVSGFAYPHPHVSADILCFGELRNDFLLHVACLNIAKIMEGVQLALTSYNPDSAYRNLETLEEDIFKRRPELRPAKEENENGQEEEEKEDGE